MKYFFPAILLLSCFQQHALAQFNPYQNDQHYSVHLNLREVKDDKIDVDIIPPVLQTDTAEFHMPRIIPGTYDIENYGRFINDFKAFDAEGNELPTKKLDENRWHVYNARKLYKIAYKADDTFDGEPSGIFQPAGTSIEDDVFLLNNFGFIGYIKDYKDTPFKLMISKPDNFYGSTSLQGKRGDTMDVFDAEDYFAVHDNPIMYCVPDTASRMVGGAKVIVSLYSPNKIVSADTAMQEIAHVLDAAAQFMGGELPVKDYTVLIYCVSLNNMGTSYGALEHHTSTVLYMPEFGGERFYSGVRDITSHEFFHIVTPLNIHSQYISDFDFINPEMSEHIWFYEGVTEYNSHLVQIRSGIYDLDEFLLLTRDKILSAEDFNKDIPLTVASRFTLDYFKKEYYNFYQKGAIAGMALDLKLLELSSGEYGLVHLLKELEQTYGKDTFFQDDQFFDIITEMTHPEMREFFARHYEGAEDFPLTKLLANAGIDYVEELRTKRVSTGNMDLGFNFDTERLRVEGTDDLDAFGRDLGLKTGDEFIEFNGEKLTIDNINDVISNYYLNTKAGDKVKVLVARPNSKGEFKEKKLKAKAVEVPMHIEHSLSPMINPTEEQLSLRNAWINQ